MTIYVGNLAFDAEAEDVQHLFGEYGTVRKCSLPLDRETGRKANELNPGRYPAQPAAQGKTREQVKAELAQAIRTGNTLANGEIGFTLNQHI